ncbi:hypothetical protein PIB30_113148, partial [Stylosanthes scabra]|nr:hypothetical protein [Stylosanthes scabra]
KNKHVAEEEARDIMLWKQNQENEKLGMQIMISDENKIEQDIQDPTKGKGTTKSRGIEIILAGNSGQRQIKKYKTKPAYYVENPDDSDEEGGEASKQMQKDVTEQQGLEMALILENTLVLERKWNDEDQSVYSMNRMLTYEDKNGKEKNKRRKGAAESNMAEETGLTKPHHKP